MKKYLIVGLGNIGATYHNTRHNIGFVALDILAVEKELSFEELRYGALTKTRFKGRTLLLLKPSTFMNNSGKAVRYWALKENIPLENILIITDDLNLPFGTLRLKTKGSDGGHNGLKDIQAQLNTTNYARLRFGIHSEEKGYDTVDFVLGKWSTEEQKVLKERCEMMAKMIFSFATQGAQNTMNQFNGK
ncbi:MAG: aminoacyl-tRNA hydrolase [Flavobacteriaceae bacterium]|nr:aminoacyl-tRNA hydrolase [Flavobacteriaceae bacterium]